MAESIDYTRTLYLDDIWPRNLTNLIKVRMTFEALKPHDHDNWPKFDVCIMLPRRGSAMSDRHGLGIAPARHTQSCYDAGRIMWRPAGTDL
jgi:hypothetical protein